MSPRQLGRLGVIVLLAFSVAACRGKRPNDETYEGYPAVSRDGQLIAFIREDAVHVTRPGKDAIRITHASEGVDAAPDWSPDGSRIVFARSERLSPWMLYVVNADGTGLRRLTEDDESRPSWSPDGGKIAFERGLPGSLLRSNVHTIGPSGNNERLLLRNAGDPAWSPDGSKIAFVRQNAEGDGKAIAVLDLRTGTTKRVVGSKSGVIEGPAWSPDGTRIAFADSTIGTVDETLSSGNPEIYVVNVDGTGLRRLTPHSKSDGSYDESPTWLTDRRIVFARASTDRSGQRLYIMNGDGSGLRRFR